MLVLLVALPLWMAPRLERELDLRFRQGLEQCLGRWIRPLDRKKNAHALLISSR
jgi:hypothetical protein